MCEMAKELIGYDIQQLERGFYCYGADMLSIYERRTL